MAKENMISPVNWMEANNLQKPSIYSATGPFLKDMIDHTAPYC
jgi:hypothetical protein